MAAAGACEGLGEAPRKLKLARAGVDGRAQPLRSWSAAAATLAEVLDGRRFSSMRPKTKGPEAEAGASASRWCCCTPRAGDGKDVEWGDEVERRRAWAGSGAER